MLTPPEQKEFDHPASILYFNVGADRRRGARRSRHAASPSATNRTSCTAPTRMELWMSHFHDCEQNTFVLMETRAK